MNGKSRSKEKFRALRAQAKLLLQSKESAAIDINDRDFAGLIHELEVHQMELELQNQELQRAREKLEASRDEYEDLFESAPVGYAELDRKGVIHKANTAAHALLGFENELIGKPFSDHLEKDDLSAFNAYLNALASDQKPSPIEVRIQGPEGMVHTRLEATTENDKNGNLRRWRLSLVDITERRQAEDTLRESEETFRSIFQHHSAVKLLIDPDTGNIVEANEAAARFYGWAVEDLKTMRIQEINLLSEDEVNEEMARAKSRECDYFEFQHRLADGSVRDVEVYSSTIEVKGKEFLHSIVHDVTKRKEAEQKIRDQYYLLDMITTTSPVAITLVDAEGRISFANPAAEATLDLTKDDITARTYNDPKWRICDHHGRPFPEEELPFSIVRRTGRPIHDVEHAIEHQDGRRILLSINAAPLKDASGKYVGMVSALTDITEQKQAEAALLERNKELHCLQRVRSSLDEGLSEEALFQSVLEAMKEGMQYPDEAVPVIILGDERYSLEAQTDNLKNGLHADIRVEGEPAGHLSVYYKSEEMILLPEEQDLVDAVSKILGHHLERTRAREKLQDREERLKLALQGADLASWDWNIQTGRLTFNERWAEMLGYSSGEIEPHVSSWVNRIHPDDKPKVMRALNDHLEGKTETYETEHRVRHRLGKWIWILDKGQVIERDAQGAPVRACGTHLDVTERKQGEEQRERLEAQLRQSQKMEAIGTLAGGIAHDFNNILSIILGNAEMVMHDLQEGSFAQESLSEVREASLRARDLVSQILLFARQKEQNVSYINIEPIAKECLKMFGASTPTTVEIRQEIEENLPLVHADPSQIQQVIMNLCTNAGQVMEAEGGTLEFVLDSVELEAPLETMTGPIPEGSYVRLLVRDTGPGIKSEDMERIFEPFFTTKSVGEGTGLGLAVVHGIVAERNGGILVESEQGRGTTFRVYLPASKEERAEEPAGEDAALPKGTERILFVDDEPMILKLGQRMLEKQGYVVETRASGTDALECFKHDPERFDLVVTDMTMPGIRGDKLAEEMMAIREDIPVVLSTGYSKQISAEKAEDLGIKAFVIKPLTRQELANTVRRVLDES